MKTLVVVPALNESLSISGVINSIRAEGFDLVVVDDGSSDGTGDIARSAGALVLRLATNLGVGGALRCGFRYAVEHGFDAVIQCDADGQHNTKEIGRLVAEAVNTGADLVIGSRFASTTSAMTVSPMRRVAMRVMALVVSRVAGTKLTDTTSGFRLIRGDLLKEFSRSFPTYYLGDTFEATYVAGRNGYAIREIPVLISPRVNGKSSSSRITSIGMIAKALTVTVLGLHFRIPAKAG